MGIAQRTYRTGDDQAGHEAHDERTSASSGTTDSQPDPRGQLDERRRVSKQLPPRWGQLGSTLVANEQLHTQVVLQRANLTRQHRLGDVQRLRGATEVQMLCNRDEVTDLAKIKITHQAGPSPLDVAPAPPPAVWVPRSSGDDKRCRYSVVG